MVFEYIEVMATKILDLDTDGEVLKCAETLKLYKVILDLIYPKIQNILKKYKTLQNHALVDKYNRIFREEGLNNKTLIDMMIEPIEEWQCLLNSCGIFPKKRN